MNSAPERLIEHFQAEGYHPRSDKHSNALCRFVLADMLDRCPPLRAHAARREVVCSLNHTIHAGPIQWNVDMVIGPPGVSALVEDLNDGIAVEAPATVRIALEVKSIMTEHGKARKNRLRDFDSLHTYVHRAETAAVAASLLVINISDRFKSPLRQGTLGHHNISSIVKETVSMFKSLPMRSKTEGEGLEALGIIIVDFDNIDFQSGKLFSRSPAPQVGDPTHYDGFIRQICNRYCERWE